MFLQKNKCFVLFFLMLLCKWLQCFAYSMYLYWLQIGPFFVVKKKRKTNKTNNNNLGDSHVYFYLLIF